MKVSVGDKEFTIGEFYQITTTEYWTWKPMKFDGAKIDPTSGKYWFYFQSPDGGEYGFLYSNIAVMDKLEGVTV